MNAKRLDPRLLTIASMVESGRVAADIGTDHGYLPIYLIKQSICPRVIACDLRAGPLAAARKNMEQAGVSHAVDLRLGNGLTPLQPMEASAVVVAGMGGPLIASILQAAPWVQSDQVDLILQPMSHPEELRQFLCQSGFSVVREEAVACPEHIYSVMLARFQGVKTVPTPLFLATGLIRDPNRPGDNSYLTALLQRLSKKEAGLRVGGRDEKAKEIATLIEEIQALFQTRRD